MQRILCKTAIFLWFIATNVIAAAAFDAAIRYPRFKMYYLFLAVFLIASYFWGLYYRLKRERGRGEGESLIRYYLRTRLSWYR
jgi:hypothetical protein